MKKLLSTVLAIIILLTILGGSVSASAVNCASEAILENEASNSEISTRAEQTMWYYAVNNDGVLLKRLWSITYGEWLTDWILA